MDVLPPLLKNVFFIFFYTPSAETLAPPPRRGGLGPWCSFTVRAHCAGEGMGDPAVPRDQAAHSSAASAVAAAHFSSAKGRAAGGRGAAGARCGWGGCHPGSLERPVHRPGGRGRGGRGPPPATTDRIDRTDSGGSDTASGPQPTRPPTFKYSLRTGEGSQLLFLN